MSESQPQRRLLRGHEIWSTSSRPGRLPISRQTWLNGVRNGHFPQPVRLGPGVVAWRAEDVERIEQQGTGRAARQRQDAVINT